MPHLIFDGKADLSKLSFPSEVHREGRLVMKIEHSWLRSDGQALLVEGVVVEYSRALHPVAEIVVTHGRLNMRLWSLVSVERNTAIQKWLLMVAEMLQAAGVGPLVKTNLSPQILRGAALQTVGEARGTLDS